VGGFVGFCFGCFVVGGGVWGFCFFGGGKGGGGSGLKCVFFSVKLCGVCFLFK